MIDTKNIKEVFVLKDCNRTANVQIWDKNNATTYLGNGECVITDPSGKVLDTTTAVKSVDRIFLHTRSSQGDDVARSVELPGSAITGLFCENYAAATEQISYLGYNGTSGNIDVNLVADTLYWIKVISKHTSHCRDVETFSWKSGYSTPTAADVVLRLAQSINIKGGVNGYDPTLRIQAEALTDATSVAIVPTGTVTTGSKTVTFSAAVTTLAVGDVLTIATVPYLVEKVISTTQVQINMPYQGASASGVALAEVPKTDNWGLKITGLPYEFIPGKYNYRIASFELTTSEDIASEFSITAHNRGKGTFKQVAELEWYCKNYQGNDKKVDPEGLRPIEYKYEYTYAVDGSAETYDLVTITWKNRETETIHGNTVQEGSVVLAIPVGAGQGDGGTTTIEEVLNKYIVTEWGIGTAISLT